MNQNYLETAFNMVLRAVFFGLKKLKFERDWLNEVFAGKQEGIALDYLFAVYR